MEQWQPIAGETRIAVSAEHRFGADALMLAHFAAVKRSETVCDLGTGCGAIAFRVCCRAEPAAVHGVDIAPRAIALAQRSAAAYTGAVRPTFAVGDWYDPRSIGAAGSFRRVICNPPYFPPGSGKTSAAPAAATARHGAEDTLEAVCRAAAWLIPNGGHFCLCHRPERLAQVMAALAEAGLTPKRLRTVSTRADAAPWLMLVDAVKGGKPGLIWEPPLADGTPEMAAIYGNGGAV